MRIELDAPNLSSLEKDYTNKAIEEGFVSTFGPFVPRFEERLARYLGVQAASCTQSGTAAIHLALHELGIGAGDEVIVPALTFVATVNPVRYVGATPVFVDVDPETWTMDPVEVAKAVTIKTKAMIPVHLYGNPCDMNSLVNVARKHDIHMIEDAAESLGALYMGRHTGTFGEYGCFSFNGNKVITTGAGGAVVGKNTSRLDRIKFLVNQARDGNNGYYHSEIGFNYRMTNLQAALGLAQMERLDGFLKKKKRFHDIYLEALAGMGCLRFQKEQEHGRSSAWFTCVEFDNGIKISSLQDELGARGIPTRRIFAPVIDFSPYQKYKKADCSRSLKIYEHGLCLPASTLNSEDEIAFVCRTLKGLF